MDYKQTSHRRCLQLKTILFALCLITAFFTIILGIRIDLMQLFQPLSYVVATASGTLTEIIDPSRYVLATQGCKINRKDPWDVKFKHHFKKQLPETCPTEPKNVLVYIHNNVIKVDSKAKQFFLNGNRTLKFACRMWSIYRFLVEKDDHSFRISKEYTEFEKETPTESEFMLVKCYINNATIYENYFYDIVKKPEVEKRCKANEKKFLKEFPDCIDRPSVLVLGVDSISNLNFLRLFPQTRDVLLHHMDAIEFFGYNKVGLNTFPCLIPYLTGISVPELRKSCWGQNMDHFDNCTFVWDSFAKTGYRTAFVENLNNYGLFTYNRGGFKRQPVDYYGRTLYLAVEKHLKSYSSGCWRGLSDDEALVRWAYEYQKQFANMLHYGHFWISKFSHDDLNLAQQADSILTRYLIQMKNEKLLNNTVIIFMSDHGLRFGEFRETTMGRFEENLPFLYVILPERFKSKYPLAVQRLKENSHRLVTTFDLYETLQSLMKCQYRSESSDNSKLAARHRGISLFSKISLERTCADSDIPTIYCACNLQEEELDTDSPLAKRIATEFVKALNNITASKRNVCVEFTIKSILSFKKVIHVNTTNDYVISLETTPGDAKFEGTFAPEGGGIKEINERTAVRYILNADIRRINMYGETSHCITNDGSLKQTCYCKKQRS